MNKKGLIIVIIIVILLVIVIGCVPFLTRKKVVEYHNLKSFHYGCTQGMYYLDRVSYDVEYQDGQYIATILLPNVEEENAKVVYLNDKEVEKLISIFNKYEVSTWDGFHKNDPNVLDGSSFSFSMTTRDGESVSASGYMKYPKNYRDVVNALDDFFESL